MGTVENITDTGSYALTTKLHGIELGDTDLNLYANNGFSSDDLSAVKEYRH